MSENNYDKVNFDGQHREFGTGAHRSANNGKGRFDLIPFEGERRTAIHYQNGATTHGERNWEKGIPFSSLWDSARRHLNQYRAGDRSEDHLAAVVWNVFAMMHFEKYKPELNDLPAYSLPATDAIIKKNALEALKELVREETDRGGKSVGLRPRVIPDEILMKE